MKSRRRSLFNIVCMAMCLSCILCVMPGCDTEKIVTELQATNAKLVAKQADLDRQAVSVRAQMATLNEQLARLPAPGAPGSQPGDDSLRAAILEQVQVAAEALAGIQTGKDLLQPLIDQTNNAIKIAQTPTSGDGWLNKVANTVLPFIPTPYREPAMLVGGLIAAIGRISQLKKASTSIAASIEALPDATGVTDKVFEDNAKILDKIQTPTAKVAVDVAQGNTDSLSAKLWKALPV